MLIKNRLLKKIKAIIDHTCKTRPNLWKCLHHVYTKFLPRLPIIDARKIISNYADGNKYIFFIEIGANDGSIDDMLNKFIVNDNWSGILVEPVESIFKKLVLRYGANKKLTFDNSAISEGSEDKEFYHLREAKELPCWANGLGSFDLEVILSNKVILPNIEDYLITEKVRCITFDQLLSKYNVNKVDILQIDTEGYDYEIIKLVDFAKVKPNIIIFEHVHLTLGDYKKCLQYLRRYGYKSYRHIDGSDTICLANVKYAQ